MATKILIPTPLRPYTDKKEAVEADGATVGELLADLTTQARRAEGASVQRAGQAAELRQRLPERRRHPLPAEGADAGVAGRHDQHHSVGGRRGADRDAWTSTSVRRHDAAATDELPQLTNDEIKRYSRHLIMPEVGMDGQRRLKAGSVLCIGAGGLGSPAAMYLAAAGVGTHRHRRLRRRRLQQPAAADHPRHAGRRPLEARVGEGSAARDQPAHRDRDLRRRRCRRRTRWSCSSRTTSSSTAPTISRRAI